MSICESPVPLVHRHGLSCLLLFLALITSAFTHSAPLSLERVNLSNTGAEGDGFSASAAITPDGRYVAFASAAENLVSSGTGTDIFLRDTCVGAPSDCTPGTLLVSKANDGSFEDNAASGTIPPAVSANGRYIDFESTATSFDNMLGHFLRDTCVSSAGACTPSTQQISILPDGANIGGRANTGFGASISHDGRYVAFAADAFLDEGGVFVRDTCIGVPGECNPSTERVSTASDGTNADNENSGQPSISGSGRYVAFSSPATNLVPGDTNGAGDIFVKDRNTGQIVRVSIQSDGAQATDGFGAIWPSISDSGRFVAFASFFGDLVADDSNQSLDIFLHDRDVSDNGQFDEPGDISTTRVSVSNTGEQATPFSDNFLSNRPAISGNGRFVAFMSRADNLTAEGSNGDPQIYVRDTCIGANTGCTPSSVLVSALPDGTLGNNQSDTPAISDDGQYVAFTSFSDNLAANDTNTFSDILVARVFPGPVPVPLPLSMPWLPLLLE